MRTELIPDVPSDHSAPVPGHNEGLADFMRRHTRPYHVQAERSGIMQAMLRGHVSREAYVLFLRNLLPIYQQLETALARHRHNAAIALVAHPNVYRSAAIMSDMNGLCGPDWFDRVPVLPAANTYAARIALIAQTDAPRLIAHAYTRYLGDLNGGQILSSLLSRTLQLESGVLAFYQFPDIDPVQFRTHYRQMIDSAARHVPDVISVVDEAAIAFRLNIDLSVAIEKSTDQCFLRLEI